MRCRGNFSFSSIVPYVVLVAAGLAAGLGYRGYVRAEQVRLAVESDYDKIVNGGRGGRDRLLAPGGIRRAGAPPVHRADPRFGGGIPEPRRPVRGQGPRAFVGLRWPGRTAFYAAVGLDPRFRDLVADRLRRLCRVERQAESCREAIIAVAAVAPRRGNRGRRCRRRGARHGRTGRRIPTASTRCRSWPGSSGPFPPLRGTSQETKETFARMTPENPGETPPELAAAVAAQLDPADLPWACTRVEKAAAVTHGSTAARIACALRNRQRRRLAEATRVRARIAERFRGRRGALEQQEPTSNSPSWR